MYLNFDSKEEFLRAHGQEAELVRGGLSGELNKVSIMSTLETLD
jgi:hypothetical protein